MFLAGFIGAENDFIVPPGSLNSSPLEMISSHLSTVARFLSFDCRDGGAYFREWFALQYLPWK
jgi:hypothetical protein